MKILFLMIIVLVLVVNGFWVFTYMQKQSVHRSINEFNQIRWDNVTLMRPFELASENSMVSAIKEIKDENGQVRDWNQIFAGRKHLIVYRFSEMHCDACIEQHLTMIKEKWGQAEMLTDKMILLVSYSNSRNIKVLKRTHHLDIPIYNITEELSFPLEMMSNPYFFILNKDLTCHSFFAAIKEAPELTISCLEKLMQKVEPTATTVAGIKEP